MAADRRGRARRAWSNRGLTVSSGLIQSQPLAVLDPITVHLTMNFRQRSGFLGAMAGSAPTMGTGGKITDHLGIGVLARMALS